MKILFIDPVIVPKVEQLTSVSVKILDKLFNVRKRYLANNLAFQQLAAVTPKKHTIKLLDERFDKINFDEECDVVGITSTLPYSLHSYEIADEFRKRSKIVVFGGSHATLLPEETKKHADSVVIGEA